MEEIVVGVPESDDSEEDDLPKAAAPAFASGAATAATQATHTGNKKAKKEKGPKRKGRFAPLIWAIAFIVVLCVAAGGFYYYAQNSYYLIEENGIVCVYRGLPGHIGSLSISTLEQQVDGIDVSTLPLTAQNRLANGIQVNSLAEADELLDEYRNITSEAKKREDATKPSSNNASASTSTQNTNS